MVSEDPGQIFRQLSLLREEFKQDVKMIVKFHEDERKMVDCRHRSPSLSFKRAFIN
jgi:hypothetical protein